MTGYLISTHSQATQALRSAGLLQHVFHTLLVWQERASVRRKMSHLNQHMLADIGLSQAEIDREIAKPFWKA